MFNVDLHPPGAMNDQYTHMLLNMAAVCHYPRPSGFKYALKRDKDAAALKQEQQQQCTK